MSDPPRRYALANNKSGEYVSKAVPTLAEAQKLLETVYARDRGDLHRKACCLTGHRCS
jgi:hypothetical protein